MKQELHRPNIFEFDDYREFVRDFIEFLRSTRPHFSLRNFSSRAGFGSPSFVQSIVSGQRNLSPSSVERLSEAFRLNLEEVRFFHLLVREKRVSSRYQRESIQKLKESYRRAFQAKPLDEDQLIYFQSWIHPIVKNVLAMHPDINSPESISKALCFEIPLELLESSLWVLKNISMVDQGDDNRWLTDEKPVVFLPKNTKETELRKKYERRLLIESLNQTAPNDEDSEYRSMYLRCSREDYTRIMRRIESFWSGLQSEFGSYPVNQAERLYQISLQTVLVATSQTKDEHIEASKFFPQT